MKLKINITIICLTLITMTEIIIAHDTVSIILWIAYGLYKLIIY